MSRQQYRLAGKRCLIVGGSGGIGRVSAQLFLDEGAKVVVADPAGTKSENLLGKIASLPCDATSSESVSKVFLEAIQVLGGLDILFHVAGGSGRRSGDGALHECSEEGWRYTLDTNLTSTFLTNRAAVGYFRQQGRGVILNMASVLAYSPAPQFFDTCAYAAAKGAIISLSLQAAARYAAEGIRVNVLAPGLIDTPMSARAVADPAIQAYLSAKQPLGPGPGRPEDCAEAALFLCSEQARFLTGILLPVDGGWRVCEGPGQVKGAG
jgi:NAD(P)-dependent dehydrogenase (short-subunit alcohol dehydrogenase family)